MTDARTRARDTDRDAAIEVVNAAYADGQLTDAERDQRSLRLREAVTFADLDAQLVDLQRPGESGWHAPVRRIALAGDGSRKGVVWGVVGLVAVLLVALWLPGFLAGDDGVLTETGADEEVAITSPRTAKGYVELTEAVREKFDTTMVIEVSLSEDSALVKVLLEEGKRRYAWWTYDGEWDEWTVGTLSDLDEVLLLDMTDLDPDVIAPSIDAAVARVDEPDNVAAYVTRSAYREGQCLYVAVSNRFGEGERSDFGCDGTQLED